MDKKQKISVVIAAAGKGSRSGLSYPKCLHEINGTPILFKLLNNLEYWDPKPNIIVSPSGRQPIAQALSKKNCSCNLITQQTPKGMGDALLELKRSSQHLEENILLTWGDLPFISDETLQELVKHFFEENSDFSLVTANTQNPYTVVLRDATQKIYKILETREMNEAVPHTSSERDIGVFLFKKDLILNFLEKPLDDKFGSISGEHGFLYIIQHLATQGFKVTSIETRKLIETVSFNSPSDIAEYD